MIETYSIGSVIYENAYYGRRKPADQNRSALNYATDLADIGLAISLETRIIIDFLKSTFGFKNIGLTGASFGGHLACIAGSSIESSIPVIPLMSWTSSSVVWTEGLLYETMAWKEISKHIEQNPDILKEVQNLKKGVIPWQGRIKPEENTDALFAMRTFADYFSNLSNYTTPVSPEKVRFVVAKKDAYYPQIDTVPSMEITWPGVEVRVIEDKGHVQGYIKQEEYFEEINRVMHENSETDGQSVNFDGHDFGNDELWIDNKTKFIAFFDPIVVGLVKLLKKVL